MLTQQVILADGASVWAQAATSRLGVMCLVSGAVLLAAIVLGVLVLRRCHGQGWVRRGLEDNDGTATVEFVLVMPVLLFLMLSLAQVTVMMGANVVVHYAAFSAARAAIVHVPANYPDGLYTPQLNEPPYSPYHWSDPGVVALYDTNGDPPNRYTQEQGRIKHDKIHQAAALTLMAVSGRQDSMSQELTDSTGGSSGADALVDALSDYYSGADEPPWVERLAADRLRYAMDNTTVVLGYPDVDDGTLRGMIELTDGERYDYAPRDDVTVYVSHRLNLSVPYVSRLFATGVNENASGYHRLVRAHCTLTNQGLRDELPPEPYEYTGDSPGPLIRLSP